MPIYEYRCEKCGDFEQTQRITEPSLQRCPKCRRKVRRLISNTSFQLRGSGWYVTDYARGGKAKGGADAPAASESADKTTKTGDGAAKPTTSTNTGSAGASASTTSPSADS